MKTIDKNKIRGKTILYGIILILFNLVYISTSAQIINGDFSVQSYVTGTGECIFNTSGNVTTSAPFQACIPLNTQLVDETMGWTVSHGTPEIFQFSPPQQGSTFMGLMWSGEWNYNNSDYNIYGEGLMQGCYQFVTGQTYTLNFKISATNTSQTSSDPSQPQGFIGLDHVYVYLANDLTPQNDPNMTVGPYYSIPTPSSEQLIYDNPGFATVFPSFTPCSVTFTANADYQILWFYPYSDQFPVDILFLTDVKFGDCVDHAVYQNTSAIQPVTDVSNYIYANTNADVLSGQDVTFIAGNNIVLNPGFSAESGSFFQAYISPCGGQPPTCFDMNTRLANQQSINANKDSNSNNGIVIFPNPSNGNFTIKINDVSNSAFRLILTDISGRKIKEESNLVNGDNSIDESNLDAGFYLCQIYSSSTLISNGRIIIQHAQ